MLSISRSSKSPSHAGTAGLGDILGIGGQNGGGLGPDRAGHEFQSAVFLGGGCERQRARRGARLTADLAQSGGDISRAFNAFQRRAHGKSPINPILAGSYHVGVAGARRAGFTALAVIAGDSVDKPRLGRNGQLTYTLGRQGDASQEA